MTPLPAAAGSPSWSPRRTAFPEDASERRPV